MDLPFEANPSAIMIYSNIIPSIRTKLYIKIFIQNGPEDILKLLESALITINFRDPQIRVSFQAIDELIHLMHKKFDVLIFETRTVILYFNMKRFN
jgi:hypothetical protein